MRVIPLLLREWQAFDDAIGRELYTLVHGKLGPFLAAQDTTIRAPNSGGHINPVTLLGNLLCAEFCVRMSKVRRNSTSSERPTR